MKRLLLLFICTLVLSGYAQKSLPVGLNKPHLMESDEIFNLRTASSGNYERGLIPIYDSIYHFSLDSYMGWYISSKEDDLVYQNNRLISQVSYTILDETWKPELMTTFSFNTNNDPDSTLQKYWYEGLWQNSGLTEEEYNTDHNQTFLRNNSWMDNSWHHDYEVFQTWDNDGHRLTRLTRHVEFPADTLINYYRYTYTYHPSGKQETSTREYWETDHWYFSTRSTYYYNASGQQESSTSEIWSNDAWVISGHALFTYSNDNRVLTITYQDLIDNEWINDMLLIVNYDNDHRFLNSIQKAWDGSGWVNLYYDESKYDQYGNECYYYWSEWLDNNWHLMLEDRSKYDQDGFRLGRSSKYYNEFGVTGDSTSYYFHTIVGLPEKTEADLVVYPNPTVGIFSIASAEPISMVEIYNNKGILLQQVAHPKQTFDISTYPSGFYFVKIHFRDRILVRKVLKG